MTFHDLEVVTHTMVVMCAFIYIGSTLFKPNK